MNILVVGSGSKGNASFIYTENSLIQIDMGLPLNRINSALASIHKKKENIQALFITHEHSDHIKGLPLYHNQIPLYASKTTLGDKIPHQSFEAGEKWQIGDFSITSFSTSHDANNPVGYLIEDGSTKLAYITDTGELSDEALSLLKDCTYYYMESNHDLDMLYKSGRPKILIDRIHGDHGHLSNVDSALYMAKLIGPNTKQIGLAHISEDCNTPEKAVSEYQRILNKRDVDFSKIHIFPIAQWEVTSFGDSL